NTTLFLTRHFHDNRRVQPQKTARCRTSLSRCNLKPETIHQIDRLALEKAVCRPKARMALGF
ncbi:MAG: hypothetical protein ACOH2J_08805, partial [Allorhizobium sp.]